VQRYTEFPLPPNVLENIFQKVYISHPKTPHPILKQSIKAIISHKTRHIAKHKVKATQNNKQSLKQKNHFLQKHSFHIKIKL
jgi:hypothetical protein